MFVKVASVILSLLCLISGLILIMVGFERSDGNSNLPLDIIIPGVLLSSSSFLIFFTMILYHNSHQEDIEVIQTLETNFNVNDFLYPVYQNGSVQYGNNYESNNYESNNYESNNYESNNYEGNNHESITLPSARRL